MTSFINIDARYHYEYVSEAEKYRIFFEDKYIGYTYTRQEAEQAAREHFMNEESKGF